jgi:hypothetical protein
MRLIQGALPLQVEGHIQDGFDFFFRKIEVADQVATMKKSLHFFLLNMKDLS